VEVIEVAEGADLGAVAAQICSALRPGDVVALEGPIGAGKTTLVQACARQLGVTEPVTSPTFALAHRYSGRWPVAHLDLYRLEGQPVGDTGVLLDYLGEDAIAFVEWPAIGADWLPPLALTVAIEVLPDCTRRFGLQPAPR
jgi:tRNA threonylcarbamoyladenosine biosynthesis protein TsaE